MDETFVTEVGAKLHRIEGTVEAIGLTVTSLSRRVDGLDCAHKQGLEARARCFNRLETVEAEMADNRRHRDEILKLIKAQGEEAKKDRDHNTAQFERLANEIKDQGEASIKVQQSILANSFDVLESLRETRLDHTKDVKDLAGKIKSNGIKGKAAEVLAAAVVFMVGGFFATLVWPDLDKKIHAAWAAAKQTVWP